MAKVDKCLSNKAKAEDAKITDAQVKKFAEKYKGRVQDFMREFHLSRNQAERKLAEIIVEGRREFLDAKKARTVIQTEIQADILEEALELEAKNSRGHAAIHGRLSPDWKGDYVGGNVWVRVDAIRGAAHGKMVEFLEKFQPRLAGAVQSTGGIREIVNELGGIKTGNEAASQIAGGVQEAMDFVVDRLQRAGVDVVDSKLGLFHRWESSRVARVSMRTWVDEVWKHIDRAGMKNELGLSMSEEELRAALREVYLSITSRGLSDTVEAAGEIISRGKREATRIGFEQGGRFIKWKNPDAWLSIHEKYGRGNAVDHIINTIDALARRAATAEILGPNPRATLEMMEKLLQRIHSERAQKLTGWRAAREMGNAKNRQTRLRSQFNIVTGIEQADGGVWGNTGQGVRDVITSATMGSAFLSAIVDPAISVVVAKFIGTPPSKVIARTLRGFFEKTPGVNILDTQLLGANLGFGVGSMADRSLGLTRVLGDMQGPAVTERISDVVLRATLLTPWTETGRLGLQIETLSNLTARSHIKFEDLDRPIQHFLRQSDISPEEWNFYRETTQWEDPTSRARFIRPEDVAARGDDGFDVANKMMDGINREKKAAIIEPDPMVRSFVIGENAPGTLAGEFLRNAFMFKGWPISILYVHLQRGLYNRGPMSRKAYFGYLIGGMTMLGALGEQANNLANGKDPQNMSDPDFWRRAFIRGGSAGLFADTLLRQETGRSSNIIYDIFGPLGRPTQAAFDLAIGNIFKGLSEDEETSIARDAFRVGKAFVPGKNGWYYKLILERAIFDEIRKMTDPKAEAGFQKQKQRASDLDQEFFAPPGEGFRRFPELGAVIGGS